MSDRARFLISFDGAKFYVRRVASTVEDHIDYTFNYKCDKHEGGPFDTIEEAATCLRDAVARSEADTGYAVTVGRVRGLTPNVQSIPRAELDEVPTVYADDYVWSVEGVPVKPTAEQVARRELPPIQIVGRRKDVS